jgi:hypothetical protein
LYIDTRLNPPDLETRKMKRPLAALIIGWLFIVAGTVGFVYHIKELNLRELFANDAVWVLSLRLLAIAGGVLTLRGANAGRWLLVAWMAYHAVLSYFHTRSELLMHLAVLAAVTYVLFHPKVTGYFKRAVRQ